MISNLGYAKLGQVINPNRETTKMSKKNFVSFAVAAAVAMSVAGVSGTADAKKIKWKMCSI